MLATSGFGNSASHLIIKKRQISVSSEMEL